MSAAAGLSVCVTCALWEEVMTHLLPGNGLENEKKLNRILVFHVE